MLNKKRFLLVGIAPAIIKNSIINLKKMGFEVVLLEKGKDLKKYGSLITEVDKFIEVDINDYESLETVSNALNSEKNIDAMFSFREHALLNTAKIIKKFGLYGNEPEVIESCIDKLKTRNTLRDAGILSPKYTVYTNISDAKAFYKSVNGPVIIKPNNLSGSSGVTKIGDEEQLETKLQYCKDNYDDSIIMLEEFLTGQEISIEAIIYKEEVTILGITQKLLYENTFIEAGHISPYTGCEMTKKQYKALVEKIVQALGIKFGPLHIEGFHTVKGFIVGEVHTRYGGDNIPIITEIASNCDLAAPIFAELANASCDIKIDCNQFSGIKYLDVEPGRVKKISGVDEVLSIKGVVDIEINCKVGDVINPIRSNSDRVGWIIVKASTFEELNYTFNEAIKKLQIVTE
ncbi:ATP-grasp domain-containing protein [Clostridium saccharoperbutylacetonicum]|uniref:ATP-grasp domain-containing protein n=1 Tax=Clostridium saccharoperbutylacetonicum TaxID=36745 RepID=UPI0039EC3402